MHCGSRIAVLLCSHNEVTPFSRGASNCLLQRGGRSVTDRYILSKAIATSAPISELRGIV